MYVLTQTLLALSLIVLASCASTYPPAGNYNSQPYAAHGQRLCGPAYPYDAATLNKLQQPYEMFGQWYYPINDPQGFVEEGTAAWYGEKFDGKPTASGEIFDMTKMTAAHPALPMNTCVKVTNLENGSWVVLRINDRGPFNDMRVIDVSEAAAKFLGFYRQGTAHVRIEALP